MSKYVKIHNVYGYFNAAQRVAKANSLTLKMEEGLTQPYTDLVNKEVFVPAINPSCSEADLMKWLGEVYHEIGHHAPKVLDALPFMQEKRISFDSLFGKLMNCIEDVRNEFNELGMWKGRDEALSFTQGYYCNQGATTIAKEGLPSNKDVRLIAESLAMVYDYRKNFQPDVALPSIRFSEVVDWSKYSHLQHKLGELETIEDVYNLAKEILDESPDHNSAEEEQKANEQFKKNEEGKDGEKEEGGKGKGKPEEGEGEEGDSGDISYKDLMGHSHDDASKSKGKPIGKIIYDHKPAVNYTPWPTMKIKKARDLSKEWTNCSRGRSEEKYKEGSKLAGVARRLFQSRTQTGKIHNKESGRLDKRDLYRIPSGAKDVFTRKKHVVDAKGTAIFLLTDNSGSMSGDKISTAAAAVALLNDACSPLGIPMKIASFTESSPACRHYIVKEYNEKRTADQVLDDYEKIGTDMNQNADGESIMWAASDLMTRSEERKILIVLSDGQPASDNGGDCYTYTKNVVKTIERWPGLEVYGIGLLDDAVRKFYKEYSVLTRTDSLEKCLLDLIKTKIFNK